MPLTSLLNDPDFDPEAVATLASAFEAAWEALLQVQSSLAEPNRAEGTRERLAKHIIFSWQMGERSSERLVALALASLPCSVSPQKKAE